MRHQQHTTTACTHYTRPQLQRQALCAVLPSWFGLTATAYVHSTHSQLQKQLLCVMLLTQLSLTATADARYVPTAATAIALCDAFHTAESHHDAHHDLTCDALNKPVWRELTCVART